MRRSVVIPVAFLALGMLAAAPAWALRPLDVRTLDNGLTLIMLEDPSVPLVTVEIAVRAGAWLEPPELDGLSHLYEHMFFKANAALPDQQAFMARVRELGMVWNGTTAEERVNYFFTLPSVLLDEGLVFMRDAIQSPLFDQQELERERQVVLGEFDRFESQPGWFLSLALEQLMWPKTSSYKSPLGDRQVIAAATREQMQLIQSRYYVPNNSALIVAGDLDADAVHARVAELFDSWERAPDPFEITPPVVHPPLAATRATVVAQPVDQATIRIGWHGPDTRRDVPATYAADVLGYALSQREARLHKALVDSGLCFEMGFGYYTQHNVGPIWFSCTTAPDTVEQALRASMAELEQFGDADYLSDEQIAAAKTMLAVQQIYDEERTSRFAHTLSFWWASAGLAYYRSYIEQLQAVTRDDLVRFVESYLTGKPFALAVMASPAAVEAEQLEPATLLEWAGVAAPVKPVPAEQAAAGQEVTP